MTDSDNHTTRVTIRDDLTATTTFVTDHLVVEFDVPPDFEPSFPTRGDHDVDNEADGQRWHAQPNSGDTTDTANCGLLVVSVRHDHSGTLGWQVQIGTAAHSVDAVRWGRDPDDSQQTAHDERANVRSAVAVAEPVLQSGEAHLVIPRLRVERRATTVRPRSTDVTTDRRGDRTGDRLARRRTRHRAPMTWSQQLAAGETPTAVAEATVEPTANRRRYVPIAIITTAVLSFVAGAMTIGAQTRPRTRTTLNVTAAATTPPGAAAGHAPTSDLTSDANVYDLAIGRAHSTPGSTVPATATGQAVPLASDAQLLTRLQALAAAGILPDQDLRNEHVDESTTEYAIDPFSLASEITPP
ncbi:MAG: hypothetical protein JWM12_1945 [Ilumatobacteraceae bacterium]|nr:hypothetical protein [Ilumatobacteraceae bacterium]